MLITTKLILSISADSWLLLESPDYEFEVSTFSICPHCIGRHNPISQIVEKVEDGIQGDYWGSSIWKEFSFFQFFNA
jgi:hypothetical protein